MKRDDAKVRGCVAGIDVVFPAYLTPLGTCAHIGTLTPADPGFQPLDTFWFRNVLGNECKDCMVIASWFYVNAQGAFVQGPGVAVRPESQWVTFP